MVIKTLVLEPKNLFSKFKRLGSVEYSSLVAGHM